MVNPTDHVKISVWDPPPHLTEASIFNIPKINLSKELIPVSNPIYEDNLSDNIHSTFYRIDVIPGSFMLHHINQIMSKARIIKALKFRYIHLHCTQLKISTELTHSILKKPRIHKVILLLENLFKRFRVIHDYKGVKALSPDSEVLTSSNYAASLQICLPP
jgi:hypothetical protein